MRADEEISGDIADMMANSQAASECLASCEICIDGLDIPAYADLPGQSPAYYPFQITQTLPLPDELHTEMRKADVDRMSISSSIYEADEVDKGLTAKMGLFEEIGHAWFVVGSQLFLWNYSDTYVLPPSCSWLR